MNRPGPGIREMKMDLQYQPLIPQPPVTTQQLYGNATSGDTVTIDTWRKTWIDNYRATKERFKDLAPMSMGALYGAERHRPGIVIGAGPSLKYSIDALRENQKMGKPIPTVSCLHNLAYLKNEAVKVDYYVSLDAGEIVLDDATEGQDKGMDYWAMTKDDVLVANITSNQKLFEKWQGKVYLFNCLVPDQTYRDETDKLEVFRHYISSGGNVGGACMYFAKAVLGCNPMVLVGLDFCWDYANEFHSYPTKYDNWEGRGLGQYITCTDVFGNQRKSYPSYFNFKCWIDYISTQVPGSWIYCGEGIVGAYKEGNIAQFQYMTLNQFVNQHKMSEYITYEIKGNDGKLIESKQIDMKQVWANPTYENNIVLF